MIKQTGLHILQEFLKQAPVDPGVYRMIDAQKKVMYVGKAKNLKKRLTSYTNLNRLSLRIKRMVSFIAQIEVILTVTEAEALLLEGNLIKKFIPPYNILLKDDKSFPYIFIPEDHAYPQLIKHRGTPLRKGSYYGPFASSSHVDDTLLVLQKAFLLRSCTDNVFQERSRPCLLYQIKRCSAPCVQKITHDDYHQLIKQAKQFLEGKQSLLQQELSLQMKEASQKTEYERAAVLRDRIRALTQIQANNTIHLTMAEDADVFGIFKFGMHTCIQVFFYRKGHNYGNQPFFLEHSEDDSEKEILTEFLIQFYQDKPIATLLLMPVVLEDVKLVEEALSKQAGHKVKLKKPSQGSSNSVVVQANHNAEEALHRHLAMTEKNKHLLERLAELFEVPKLERIEVYDNSHISGTHALGCMIVAGTKGFLKKEYKRFTIQSIKPGDANQGDDYQMMREVIQRRFSRAIRDDHKSQGLFPDLVLIDGGRGQLNAVLEVLHDLGLHELKVVGIAKGPDRNAGRETFYIENKPSFSLKEGDHLLYYLQRLRDEAHRYAITSHRDKRSKDLKRSSLDDVKGIGGKRKKMLLTHFGSVKAIMGASVEDLQRVSGISKQLAEEILQHFKQS
jgi:excinuclease ABC subunit C